MLRVRTTFTGMSGAPYLNTFYFLDEVEDATAAAEANTLVGNFWVSMAGGLSNQLSWSTAGSVDLMDADGTLTGTFGVTPRTGAGGETGDPLPHANQMLIRWSTSSFLAGRRIKGRTYVPGLTELNSTNGQVGSSTITLLQPAINTLAAAVNPTLAVWSRPAPLATPPRGGTVVAVDTGSIWSQFAVLRSRRD